MDRQNQIIRLILKRLGIINSGKDILERMILRKIIYLVQSAGLRLGYYFSWYLNGPYCKDLLYVDDILQQHDCDEDVIIDEQSLNILERIKSLFEVPAECKFDDLYSWLELLSSVHFLINKRQVSSLNHNTTINEILIILDRYEKKYTIEQVEFALEELKNTKIL